MAEDWSGRPLLGPEDPQAAEREQRRHEREASAAGAERQARAERRRRPRAAARAAPRRPPPEPPVPPRSPEEDFWDEDPEPFDEEEAEMRRGRRAPAGRPSRAAPPRGPRPPRRGSGVLAALRRHPLSDRRGHRRARSRSGSWSPSSSPSTATGIGPRRRHDPEGRERQRGRRHPRRRGRRLQLDPVPDPGDDRRQALRSLPGALRPRQGHVLRRGDRRALQGAGEEGRHGDDPRGRQPRPGGAARRRSGPHRQLRERERPLQVPEPGELRRQGRQEPRGLPLSGHLRTEAGGAGGRPRPAAARRTSSGGSRAST